MKRFGELIEKSAKEPEKKKEINKKRFKIAKADDEKHQAFGWANVSIRTDGELIEDWQGDTSWSRQPINSWNCTGKVERCTKEAALLF